MMHEKPNCLLAQKRGFPVQFPTRRTSSTSSSDLALNKLTASLDERFSKINEKHSLLNSSEKPANVVKDSSKYLEEIKLYLSEIPTRLQHAQIKNHGTESTPPIDHVRLKAAAPYRSSGFRKNRCAG